MALISVPFTFSSGAVIVASQHNSCNSVIYSDYNGNIDNTNIATSAAIAYSKLNLATSIVNADINASAAIVASKLDLTSPGSIGTTAPAAGKFTTLEGTTTLKLGTTHQGDILYDNGTSLVRLTPGTSGQFLQTQGAGANPQWGGIGLTFVSATTFTTAASTGDIAVTSGQYYFARVVITVAVSNAAYWLRFNNDTSTNYISGTTTAQSKIVLDAGTPDGEIIDIYLPLLNSTANAYCYGTALQSGSTNGVTNFSGKWTNATVTSFRILHSDSSNISGTVYLYKYSLA